MCPSYLRALFFGIASILRRQVFEIDPDATKRNGGEVVYRNLTSGSVRWGTPVRYIYKNVAGYWIITEASDSVVAVDRSAEGKFRGRALMIELPKEKQYRGSLSPTTVHERTALLETRIDKEMRPKTDLPELVSRGTWELRSDRTEEITAVRSSLHKLNF